jgi:ABC-type transporter Mla MlaB component
VILTRGMAMLEAVSGGWYLKESATFANCAALFQQGSRLLLDQKSSQPILELDCTALTQIDSSLLAVLLDWQQQLLAKSGALRLKNVPSNLKHLAKLYSVETWIEGLN